MELLTVRGWLEIQFDIFSLDGRMCEEKNSRGSIYFHFHYHSAELRLHLAFEIEKNSRHFQ